MAQPHLRYFLDEQPVVSYTEHGLGREDGFQRMLERAEASLAPGEAIDHAFEGDPRHRGTIVQRGQEYWWFRFQIKNPHPENTGE